MSGIALFVAESWYFIVRMDEDSEDCVRFTNQPNDQAGG